MILIHIFLYYKCCIHDFIRIHVISRGRRIVHQIHACYVLVNLDISAAIIVEVVVFYVVSYALVRD